MRCQKGLWRFFFPAVASVAAIVLFSQQAVATVTFWGDVSPDEPSGWSAYTNAYIGYTSGDGSVGINGGSSLTSGESYIGYGAGTSGTMTVDGGTWNHGMFVYVAMDGDGQLSIRNGGTVGSSGFSYGLIGCNGSGLATVDGTGSSWSVSYLLMGGSLLGGSGVGTLNISNGGLVSVSDITAIGSESSISFNGGTLSTPSLEAAGSSLVGTGAIIGLTSIISDVDLTFNGASTSTGTIVGSSVTAAVDLSTPSGYLGIGYDSTGTLAVLNGAQIYSTTARVGFTEAAGTATVDGSNSLWSITEDFYIGTENDTSGYVCGPGGTATIEISNGGMISVSGTTYIPLMQGSSLHFNGGTLSTTGLEAETSAITGTGTITGLKGITGDMNVTFDGASSTTATINESVVAEIDLSSAVGDLALGYYGGTGTLAVQNGAQIYSRSGTLGMYDGSSGTATVDGSGSSWTISGRTLTVGLNGDGTLSVTNGGAVSVLGYGGLTIGTNATGTVEIGNGSSISVEGSTYLPTVHSTASSSIHFSGGTLSTKMLEAKGSSLTGTGTIAGVKSIISDLELAFDGSSSGTGTINGNIDVSADLSSAIGSLGLGYGGTGTLTVRNGAPIYSTSGFLGYNTGTSGTATVDGSGSSWSISGALRVGLYGDGTLNILNGGHVASGNTSGYGPTSIGWYADSSGTATVDGADSLWSVTGHLYLGIEGDGSLYITNGGSVSVSDTTYFAEKAGATGKLFFGGTGGTLATKSLYTSFSNANASVSGAGTINTRGLVSDLDITFDGTGNASKTVNSATINVDAITSSGAGVLGAGYMDEGSITIKNGAAVYSAGGYLGYQSGSSGSVTITGTGSQWAVSNNYLYVGNQGDGQIDVVNGGSLVTSYYGTYLGFGASGWGMITVSGSDSTWTTSTYESVSVGYNGYATVKVLNGGSIVSSGNAYFNLGGGASSGVGQLIVDGFDTTMAACAVNVGNNGTGYLYVTNGGLLTTHTTNRSTIGNGSSSAGTATVSGANSTWNNVGSLCVGNQGNGLLKINAGGAVTVGGTTYVGCAEGKSSRIEFSTGTLTTQSLFASPNNAKSALTGTGVIDTQGLVSDVALTLNTTGVKTFNINSNVTVNLDTSDSSNRGDLGAGYWGSGTLNISNGATAYSANGYLAYYNTAAGTATVTGADSTWDLSGTLNVGYAGTTSNVLNVNSGATVAAAAITVGNASVLNIDGGTLKAKAASTAWLRNTSATGYIYVQGSGATIDTNGYDVRVPGQLLAGTVTTGGGLTKTGNGTLTLIGANTYTGLTVVNGGTLELGEAAQDVVLAGAGADVQAGTLAFDYSSTAPDIQTLLTASYTGGTAAWTTGQFLSTTSDGTHGLGWADDGASQVTVMYTLYGDSNLDGSVNGTDLNAVLSYYNQSSQVWVNGDFNYDGSVNGTDLNTVLSNYNQSLPASTAAVPEPSTLLLMVLGLAGLLAWRKLN